MHSEVIKFPTIGTLLQSTRPYHLPNKGLLGHNNTYRRITSQLPYFFDQTLLLLFISLLVLCGYYSRAAFISLESPETSTTAG